MSTYNLGTASGRIEIDGKAGAAGFKVVETAANTFFDVVQRKVDRVESLGRKIRNTGAVGVASFGAAIKVASDFETQMSGVEAVAGGTEEQMESLRQKAMQLGADTSFSASEAALALEELVKAGLDIDSVLNGAADGAVALAAAGGISLPQAATIAANAMNQFGLGADELVGVADTLAGVANVSASEVGEIGQSLSQVGAVANLAGLSMRDTAIAIGEMSDAGITGSDAGTALKTMLNNLIPVSDRQTQKFQDLGLLTYDLADANKTLQKEGLGTAKSIDGVNKKLSAYIEEIGKGEEGTVKNTKAVQDLLLQQGGLNNAFFDSKGNIKELGDLQGVLSDALEGQTNQQKLANLEVLFGADAMRAAAIMAKNGAEGYERFSEAVGQTSAAEVAEARLNNLGGAAEEFGGSMETALITIGNVFLPIVTKVVKGATAVVNVFNSLPGPIKTAIAVIVGIVSVMALLVGTILASLSIIAAFVLQWYALRVIGIATGFLKGFIATQRAGLGVQAAWNAGLATASARTSRLAKVTSIASKAILIFSRAMRAAWLALLGPIGVVIAIVLALAAVGYLLYQRFEPFRNLVNSIASAIRDNFVAAWNALLPLLKAAGAALLEVGRKIGSDLLPFLIEAGKFLQGVLMAAFAEIGAVVQDELMPALAGLADVFKNDVAPALQDLWAQAQPVLQVVAEMAVVVGGLLLKAWGKFAAFMIGTVYPVLITIFGFIVGTMAKAIANVIGGIATAIGGVIKVIAGLVTFVTGVLTGDWSKAWDGIKQVVSGFVDIIAGLFGAMFENIIGVVQAGFDAVVGWFSSKLGEADTATGGILSSVLGKFVGFFTGLISFIVTSLTFVKNIFVTIIMGLFTFWSTIWTTFAPVIIAVFNLIKAIIGLAWAIIKGIFMTNLMFIAAIVRALFTGIAATIRFVFNLIKSIVLAAWNFIKARFSEGTAFLGAIWDAVWGRIGGRVSSAAATIRGKISSLMSQAKSLVSSGLSAVSNFFNTKVQEWVDKIADGVGDIIDKLTGLGQRALDAVSGFGSLLFDAGAALINGLIEGITSKIDGVTGAVSGLAGKVRGFFPGSPVKEGPLTSWNRGGAGKRLIDMLADGLKDTDPLDGAMKSVASYVNGISAMTKPELIAASATSQKAVDLSNPSISSPRMAAKKRGGGAKASRFVSGEFVIGPDGRVWIEGIAQDVIDENEEFKEDQKPKGGRRG